MKTRLIASLTVAAVLLALPAKVPAAPPDTTFTVQGRLIQDNQLVDGLVDFDVALFAEAVGGTPIAQTTVSNVLVKAGLYVVELDFGAQNFLQGCFLEFRVRIPAGSGTSELVPIRTRVTATPYAVQAITAETAATVTVPLVLNGQTVDQTVLNVDQQAASGAAVQIVITQSGNPSFVQKLFTEGTGGAQSMVLSNPANSAAAVVGVHDGLGRWGDYSMTNPLNPSPVQSWRHDGLGGLLSGRLTNPNNSSYCYNFDGLHRGGYANINFTNPNADITVNLGTYAGVAGWEDFHLSNIAAGAPASKWLYDGVGPLDVRTYTNPAGTGEIWRGDYAGSGTAWALDYQNGNSTGNAVEIDNAGMGSNLVLRSTNPANTSPGAVLFYDGRSDAWRIVASGPGATGYQANMADPADLGFSTNGSAQFGGTMQADTILANDATLTRLGSQTLLVESVRSRDVDISNSLFVDGHVQLGDEATDTVTIAGDANVQNTLQANTILANDATMTSTTVSSLIVDTAAMNTVTWADAFGGTLDIASANVQNTLTANNVNVQNTLTAGTILANDATLTEVVVRSVVVTANIVADDATFINMTSEAVSGTTFTWIDATGGSLDVANANVQNTLQASDVTVSNSLNVAGDATVNGNLNLPNDVTIGGVMTAQALVADGALIGGDVDVAGGIKVATDATTTVPLAFSTPLMGSNDLTFGFDDPTTPIIRLRLTRTDLTVDTDLNVTGDATVDGVVTAQAAVLQGLVVDGDTVLGNDQNDTVLVAGTLATGKNLDVGGNTFLGADDTTSTTVRGDLTVNKEIVAATLIVAGDSQFGIDANDTFCVNALIQAKGGIHVGDPNNPTIKFNADGSAEICGNLIVKGGIEHRTSLNDVTFPSTETYTISTDDGNTITTAVEVDGSGNTTFNGNMTVQSDTTIAGVLQTSSLRDGAGALGSSGEFLGIDQTGDLAWSVPPGGGGDPNPTFETVTVTGNTSLGDDLNDSVTISGNTTIGGTLSASGNTNFGSAPGNTHTFTGDGEWVGSFFVRSDLRALGTLTLGNPSNPYTQFSNAGASFDVAITGNAPGNLVNGLTVADKLAISGGPVGPALFVSPGNTTSSTLEVIGFSSSVPTVAIGGDVAITGNLSKGGGSFKINHPLDPENQYLYHSFVESPDMMNIYNGNVVTDQQGYAVVTMPEWFESLNRDFRYQLTAIGTFAQAIVAEEIHDGAFVIQTDKPDVKVSWQVTGVRQDPWANANRIPIEEQKSAKERGKYLHPSVYDLPEEMGVQYEARQRGLELRQSVEARLTDAGANNDE